MRPRKREFVGLHEAFRHRDTPPESVLTFMCDFFFSFFHKYNFALLRVTICALHFTTFLNCPSDLLVCTLTAVDKTFISSLKVQKDTYTH